MTFPALSVYNPRMYEVTIKKDFAAAHRLSDIGGKCEDLHGHNFAVEVTLGAPGLDGQGLLVDFRDVKKWLGEILDELDHKCLNDVPYFSATNPSSENVARFIYDRISAKLPDGLAVARVTVWESEDARVAYTGEAR